jgi:dienelactone hydrolase
LKVATIALFHSALGLRPGIRDAAELLRSRGHDVHIVDQYDGKVFDDYKPAMAYIEELGFQALMARALELTAHLPDGFVTAGFSNGGGMAEYVAVKRIVRGVLLFSAAADPAWFKVPWPRGVPVQVHYTLNDPWREQDGIDALVAAVKAAGATIEVFDYPGSGHLFTDRTLTDEYQPAEAELMWSRALEFLERVPSQALPGRAG